MHVASDRGRALSQLDDGTAAPEVDALSSTGRDGRAAVVVWHHCDDQYQRATAGVAVTVRGLPGAGRPGVLRHFRIDASHSDSHTAWVAANRPADPTADQLRGILARSALERCAEDVHYERLPDEAEVRFQLPMPGVSLLEWAPG